jgi:cytochrome c-type biogenesis protein CcmE
VRYQGIVPDLFREGQGVVAEGKLDGGGIFVADTVLAKHDEKYMPREVVDALKKQGRWQEGADGRPVVSQDTTRAKTSLTQAKQEVSP